MYQPSVGVLCGDCVEGHGVSVLTNKCVTCSDASGVLIALLSKLLLCPVPFKLMLHLRCILSVLLISVPMVISSYISSCHCCSGVYESHCAISGVSKLAISMYILPSGRI